MVSRAVLRLVSWWASPAVLQGIPLGLLKTEMTLFTDASTQGWEQIEPAAPVRYAALEEQVLCSVLKDLNIPAPAVPECSGGVPEQLFT